MSDKTALGDRQPPHYGDERLPLRVWEKIQVDAATGYWIWTASKDRGGYGRVYYERTRRRAHVVIYRVLVGPTEPGRDLDHLCRVRHCVNPAHLEPVTRQENLSRGVGLVWMKRAERTHCNYGHPYSGDNLGHDGVKGRRCRTCDAQRKREYKQRKREASK